MVPSKPNILVFHPKQAKEYAKCIRDYGFPSVMAASTREELERYLPSTEVILGWKFPTSLLSQPIASSVRWFQSTGAGVDDFIADASIPDTIQLTRIVDEFGNYISEYVFTFLLYLLKNVPRMQKAKKERRWDSFFTESLAGKRMGVAGLGSIGAEVIRKARAFDMHVYGLSLSGKNADLVDIHYTPKEWKEFVKELDYLVLTLPLTKETYHIMNRDLLLAMKPKACLINVGRGALINEKDLLSVVQSGYLQAAILDVFETEPLPENHAFYSLPNIYLTSHLSGPSTIEGVCRFFITNLNQYMSRRPLQGLVDRTRGY